MAIGNPMTQTPPINPGPPQPPQYPPLGQFQFNGYGQQNYHQTAPFQQGWSDTMSAIGGLDPASRARVEEAFKAMGPIQPGMGRGIEAWRKAYNSVVDPQMSQEGTQTPPIWPGPDQTGAKGGGKSFDYKPGFTTGLQIYEPGSWGAPGGAGYQPGIGPTAFMPPPSGFGGTNPQFQTGGGFQSRPPYGGQGPMNQRPAGGDQMYRPPRPTRGPRMTKPNESRQMRPNAPVATVAQSRPRAGRDVRGNKHLTRSQGY